MRKGQFAGFSLCCAQSLHFEFFILAISWFSKTLYNLLMPVWFVFGDWVAHPPRYSLNSLPFLVLCVFLQVLFV